jgi:hypothetical protein
VSYTVPIPKGNNASVKLAKCEDFRGIAINSVFAKLFEKSLLGYLSPFLTTEANQFGFKAGLGCSHAIYCARALVDNIVTGRSTANICALDISKAFPSVNHSSLFIKLMDRKVPEPILALLEYWYSHSWSCVKWRGKFSSMFKIECGVLQGSCLAPALFGMCINDVLIKVGKTGRGYILVYADDILLISRSLFNLQWLINIVELELLGLDLHLNIGKCVCLRVGERFKADCGRMVNAAGREMEWKQEITYLGVVLVAGRKFGASYSLAKRKFNACANSILGKLGGRASEMVTLDLIRSKCMPVLLYGCEACPTNKTLIHSLDFNVNRFMFKLFHTSSKSVVDECLCYFNFSLPNVIIPMRTSKFMGKFALCDNEFCKFIAVLSGYSVCGLLGYEAFSAS